MKTLTRAIAAAEMLLIFPAALFMTAVFVRNLTPVENEPAHTAERIVTWYVHLGPRVGLWGLLMALPLIVLILGAATLVRIWSKDAGLRQAVQYTLAAIRAHLATLVVAAATLTAGGVLAMVAVHVLTD